MEFFKMLKKALKIKKNSFPGRGLNPHSSGPSSIPNRGRNFLLFSKVFWISENFIEFSKFFYAFQSIFVEFFDDFSKKSKKS